MSLPKIKKNYNDLDILFLHIDNKATYLNHLKKLKDTKPHIKIDNKNVVASQKVFLKSKEINRQFNRNVSNLNIKKENSVLEKKIVDIFFRDKKQVNTIRNNALALKKSKEYSKQLKNENLLEENKRYLDRIKNANMSIGTIKYYNDEFDKHVYFMRFNKSFNLPDIQQKTNKFLKERHHKMNSVSSKINLKSTISGQTQESDDNTESKNDNNNETKENNESIKPTSNNENNSVIVEESDIND